LTKPRINVADAVADCAPPPPPCFHNGHIWREYLTTAAEYRASRGSHYKRPSRMVFTIAPDGRPTYNPGFDFCQDCTQERATQAETQGRCHPDHFRQVAKPTGES